MVWAFFLRIFQLCQNEVDQNSEPEELIILACCCVC
jgi:hypothetical protein